MRTPYDFMNEIIKRARHRSPGDTFAINQLEWPELGNDNFRSEAGTSIANMQYIPFRTVRFVRDTKGWTFIATVRPGNYLVDQLIPQSPSWWPTWIKRWIS